MLYSGGPQFGLVGAQDSDDLVAVHGEIMAEVKTGE